MQYRGVMWLHGSGNEWTPYSLFVSKHGGLELNLYKDTATIEALAGALPSLVGERLSLLQERQLDSEFFNGLVAPDTIRLSSCAGSAIQRSFKQRRSDAEWKASTYTLQVPELFCYFLGYCVIIRQNEAVIQFRFFK